MSIEYRDGSFSENMPVPEAMEAFSKALNDGTARSLHVGSELELRELKRKKTIEAQLKGLEERVSAIEEAPVESEVIAIPTRDEIVQVLRGKNLKSGC